MPDQKWPENLWAKLNIVGGRGGGAFNLIGQAGSRVKSLRVNSNPKGKKFLRGVSVTFSDGKTETAGIQDGPSQEFTFEDGEKVKELKLWGDGTGIRTGRILFTTNKDKTFDFGQDTEGQDEFPMDIGSGYLIGFTGRCGDEIDCMSSVFLKPAKKVIIDKIEYPTLDSSIDDLLTPENLQREEGRWEGAPYVFKFTGSESRTSTKTWNNKVTTEFGLEATWKAGVPLVAHVETKATFKQGYQHDWGHTDSNTTMLQWNTEHKIDNEKQAVACTATIYKANMDIEYTGMLNLTMGDDQTFTFPTKGTLEQVLFSKVIVSAKYLNAAAGASKDSGSAVAGESRSLEDDTQDADDRNQEREEDPSEEKEEEVERQQTGDEDESAEVDEDTPEDEVDHGENEEDDQQEDLSDENGEGLEEETEDQENEIKDDTAEIDEDQEVNEGGDQQDDVADDDNEEVEEEAENDDGEEVEGDAQNDDDEGVEEKAENDDGEEDNEDETAEEGDEATQEDENDSAVADTETEEETGMGVDARPQGIKVA